MKEIKNILYIKGHWESGHDGQYPIVLDIDTNNIAKPFLASDGWGWGLMGGQHSFKDLCSFIEDYNREESKTVYEILKKSCEEQMSHEEVVGLLMTYIGEKERVQKDFSNSVGMMDCIFGNDRDCI